jgi:hypothetical protein
MIEDGVAKHQQQYSNANVRGVPDRGRLVGEQTRPVS